MKFLNRPIIYSLLFSTAILIPVVLDVFPKLEIGLKIFIIIIFFSVNTLFGYYDIKTFTIRINLENLLELMIKSVYRNRYEHYRANIMLYGKWSKSLKIYYSYNMVGHHDRNIIVKPNDVNHVDLCASQAYRSGEYSYLKCREVSVHNELVRHHRVWEDMKSVVSIPIHNKKRNKIIGVLNIDSEYTLRTTQFNNPKNSIMFNSYLDIIEQAIG